MKTAIHRLLSTVAITAALVSAPAAALAQNYLVKELTIDAAATKADQERQIIDIVQSAYGRNAVVNTGTGLSPEIDDQIVAGQVVPAGAPISPLPEKIDGRLPQITSGARWVGIGKHLVEIGEGNRMETVIYYALP